MYCEHRSFCVSSVPLDNVRTLFPSTPQTMRSGDQSIEYMWKSSTEAFDDFPAGTSSTELNTPQSGCLSSELGAKTLVCQWEGSPPSSSMSISSRSSANQDVSRVGLSSSGGL